MTQILELETTAQQTRPRLLRSIVLPLGFASASAVWLVWGQSHPGFPTSFAVLALVSAVVALVLGFRARPPGRRSGVLLLAVVVVLSAGIVGSRATGSAPLDLRWSRSVTAFDAEVAVPHPRSARAAASDTRPPSRWTAPRKSGQ